MFINTELSKVGSHPHFLCIDEINLNEEETKMGKTKISYL